MREPKPFDVMFDSEVREGTAELYSDRRVIYFHSEQDYNRWRYNGDGFKLINHWIKAAPPPRYK